MFLVSPVRVLDKPGRNLRLHGVQSGDSSWADANSPVQRLDRADSTAEKHSPWQTKEAAQEEEQKAGPAGSKWLFDVRVLDKLGT